MSAHVYCFESHKYNHEVIECLMRTMIRRRGVFKHRDTFHRVSAAVLGARRLRSMRFRDFYITPRKGAEVPTVRVRARVKATDACPGCGAPFEYEKVALIQVAREGPAEDRIVWGCVRCCTVFSRLEQKGEDADDSVGTAAPTGSETEH